MAQVETHTSELAGRKGPSAKILLLEAKFNEFLIIRLRSAQIPDFIFPPHRKNITEKIHNFRSSFAVIYDYATELCFPASQRETC